MIFKSFLQEKYLEKWQKSVQENRSRLIYRLCVGLQAGILHGISVKDLSTLVLTYIVFICISNVIEITRVFFSMCLSQGYMGELIRHFMNVTFNFRQESQFLYLGITSL